MIKGYNTRVGVGAYLPRTKFIGAYPVDLPNIPLSGRGSLVDTLDVNRGCTKGSLTF